MARPFLPRIEYIASSNGKPKAVILDIKDWERIAETMKILSTRELTASIARARKQLRRKTRLLTHREVFSNL